MPDSVEIRGKTNILYLWKSVLKSAAARPERSNALGVQPFRLDTPAAIINTNYHKFFFQTATAAVILAMYGQKKGALGVAPKVPD